MLKDQPRDAITGAGSVRQLHKLGLQGFGYCRGP